MNKQLILIDKNEASKKIPSIIKADDLCYYISKDFFSFTKLLQKAIPEECKVLSLGGIFNKEIKLIRRKYIDLFADLAKKHDSLEWWSTQMASKNSATIPLQLNITYLFCACSILNRFVNDKNFSRLILIADSHALIDSVVQESKKIQIENNFNLYLHVKKKN